LDVSELYWTPGTRAGSRTCSHQSRYASMMFPCSALTHAANFSVSLPASQVSTLQSSTAAARHCTISTCWTWLHISKLASQTAVSQQTWQNRHPLHTHNSHDLDRPRTAAVNWSIRTSCKQVHTGHSSHRIPPHLASGRAGTCCAPAGGAGGPTPRRWSPATTSRRPCPALHSAESAATSP
jgi:hypothetical protein